jgi:hypothetical protein
MQVVMATIAGFLFGASSAAQHAPLPTIYDAALVKQLAADARSFGEVRHGALVFTGTFQIINGQKVGGNVASYFCVWDGGVLHAVPGQVNAQKLLEEAHWAYSSRPCRKSRPNWTPSTLTLKP